MRKNVAAKWAAGGLGGTLGGHLGVVCFCVLFFCGGTWGTLGGRGTPGDALYTNCCKQTAFENPWFYYMSGYIWVLRVTLGHHARKGCRPKLTLEDLLES